MTKDLANWWFRWWTCRGLRGFHTKRLKTAQRLGILKDERAWGPLVKALTRCQQQSPMHYGRNEEMAGLVKALGCLGGDRSLMFLRSMLSEYAECWHPGYVGRAAPNCEISLAAIEALSDLRADDDLLNALASKHTLVRLAAVNSLGNNRVDRAARPLLFLLADPCSKVRIASAAALARIGDNVWTTHIQGNIRDFVRLGESRDRRVFEVLISVLIGKDGGFLRNSHDCEARGVEYPKDINYQVCGAAALGLAALGDQRAIEPLIRSLGPHGFIQEAVCALEQLGEPIWRNIYNQSHGWGEFPTMLASLIDVDPRAIVPLSAHLAEHLMSDNQCEAAVKKIHAALDDPQLSPLLREVALEAFRGYDNFILRLKRNEESEYPWARSGGGFPRNSSEIRGD